MEANNTAYLKQNIIFRMLWKILTRLAIPETMTREVIRFTGKYLINLNMLISPILKIGKIIHLLTQVIILMHIMAILTGILIIIGLVQKTVI